ncbi:MAG: hypothetical protein QG657_2259 [Acidobacteriota bacterium]|nr:hypothetical protein [Acidobacteriota bacterium]
MSKFKKDSQQLLLEQLRFLGYGQADSENSNDFPKYWYPISQHLRAFDPDVVLVVGNRGTGKSALFKAVFENNLLPYLEPFDPLQRLPYLDTQHLKWIPHGVSEKNFPDAKGVINVMNSPDKATDFWFTFLVRKLHKELCDSSIDELSEIKGGDPEAILKTFDKLGNKPLLALDSLDEKLEKEDSWIFIGYDELDRLGGSNWDAMTWAVRGLIDFWSSYSRRWRRIRAKIFLRSDLFRRHSSMGGAELAKLAANRVELTWSDKNLFSMLIKRIANTSDDLYNYCKSAKIPFKKDKDPIFGYIPDLSDAEDARPFIERIIGKYMGAGNRKGQSFTWVLDHLRDSKNMVTPRLLVRLFEISADKEWENPGAKVPHLFRPATLRRALDDISNDHVTYAYFEWPWLDGIKKRIRENKLVPWPRKELQKLLSENWEDSWSDSKTGIKPPAADAREFIDYLKDLGIFRERLGDRIDVPDIYLSGLGLVRRGGVKRK